MVIAPEYARLRDRLTWGGPFRPGAMVLHRDRMVMPSSLSGVVPYHSAIGRGIQVDTNTDRWEYAAHEGAQSNGDTDFTVATVFTLGAGDGTSGLFAARSAATAGYWNLYAGSLGSTPLLAFFMDGMAGVVFWNLGTSILARSDGVIHTAMLRRRKGGTFTLFFDGVRYADQVQSGTPTSGNHPLVVGHIQTAVNWDWSAGAFFGAFVWKGYAPTDTEALAFMRDPWGMFRFHRRVYKKTSAGVYPVSLAGTLTLAGVLANLPAKSLAGTLTSSGAAVKRTDKVLAGVITPAGAAVKQTNKVLAGTLTSSGAFSGIRTALLAIAGTLTTAGTLAKVTAKNLAGTLTSSGALAKLPAKVLAGTLGLAGTATKQTNKLLAGTLTSSGALAVIRTVLLAIAGTLGLAGALSKRPEKNLGGTLTSSGTATKSVGKLFGGTLGLAGSVQKSIGKLLAGVLGLAGSLVAILGGTSDPPRSQMIDAVHRREIGDAEHRAEVIDADLPEISDV